MAHDGTGTQWNTTFPANAEFLQDAAKEMRDLRLAMGIRLNKEHTTLGAASAGGEHKAGSAVMYSQASPGPTQRPDAATVLGAADEGRLWFDKTTKQMRRWDGTQWLGLESYALLSFSVVAGTEGGNITAGVWTTRQLNTEESDVDGIVSLPGANVFRLQAGKYRVKVRAAAWLCGGHQIRLYNVTDGAVVLNGATHYAGTSNTTSDVDWATLEGEFTITVQKDFRIEHNCTATNTGNGMGKSVVLSGNPNNVYMLVDLRKLAS